MTIDEAIEERLKVIEVQEKLYEEASTDESKEIIKNATDNDRQLAEWLTDYKELEAKHWDECRQIAHYDNDVKHLCLIIQDRISYVTDYGKAILEGKYSDSYDYNKGYCTALNDILDMIHEITGTEEG